MNETMLRVVQALTIQDTFNYVLVDKDIADLILLGYIVKCNDIIMCGMYNCIISNRSGEDKDYISLGDVCRGQLGQQCQYCSRYADINWHSEYIYCGAGLRITLNKNKDYHQYKIHKDDVVTFVNRVKLARGI